MSRNIKKTPTTMVTVQDLSQVFYGRLMTLTQNFDEVILVFDTYKPDSMKSATRQTRCQGKDPVQYQVRDETTMRKLIPLMIGLAVSAARRNTADVQLTFFSWGGSE